MALIRCNDCQTEMSDQAAACPRCGRPNAAASAVASPRIQVTAKGGRAGSAVLGATLGFALGTVLVWQGCAHGQAMTSQELTLAAFGGIVSGILGAILGAVIG